MTKPWTDDQLLHALWSTCSDVMVQAEREEGVMVVLMSFARGVTEVSPGITDSNLAKRVTQWYDARNRPGQEG